MGGGWTEQSHRGVRRDGDATTADARISGERPPGWITFSIDGRRVYSASGEVFDAKTKKIITLLKDEHGGDFQTEKLLEIDIDGNKVVRAGSSFGVGQKMTK